MNDGDDVDARETPRGARASAGTFIRSQETVRDARREENASSARRDVRGCWARWFGGGDEARDGSDGDA